MLGVVTDTRGVSTSVGYILALLITSLLISGLLVAGGSFLEGQRETIAREELSVAGEQLAAGVQDADRLAGGAAGPAPVVVRVALPDRVAGTTYQISVTNTTAPGAGPDQPYRYTLTLASPTFGFTETTDVRTHVEVENASLVGGDLTVTGVDGDDDGEVELELRDDTRGRALSDPVRLPHGEVVYVDGGSLRSVGDDDAPMRYDAPGVALTGPKAADFDLDARAEIPYVNASRGLTLVDETNETSTLVASGVADQDARLVVGRWDGSALSVFYVGHSEDTVYRVEPDEAPTAVFTDAGNGVVSPLGTGDIDGDGAQEFVYLGDGGQDSKGLYYVDDDGSVGNDIPGIAAEENASPAIGPVADLDGDGRARVLLIDGGSLLLVDEAGSTTTLVSGVDNAPVGVVDVDRDGHREVVYLDGGTLTYVDEVMGANTAEPLQTDTGASVSASAETGGI